MTTSIILTTSFGEVKVYEAVKRVGFKEPTMTGEPHTHQTVDKLVLQIHQVQEGFRMEFDDWSGRFPTNPEAVGVLKELYRELPDVMYTTYTFPPKSHPDGPLSEFLASLE